MAHLLSGNLTEKVCQALDHRKCPITICRGRREGEEGRDELK